jgi:hypothetical protein
VLRIRAVVNTAMNFWIVYPACNDGLSVRTVLSEVTDGWLTACCFINPLKTKLFYILFKNSVRTSKRTPTFTITKINWLTLFKFNPLKTKLV